MQNSKKLWNKDFLILWQGQLVSTAGDAVYSIALGFWVLAVTGSTAMMGTLMAASTLPGVLISPFAGVLIDRAHKKRLFIAMDLLRSVCILLIAGAAWNGALQVWMVFAAGIILSLCGAVFSPGVLSSVPDLVPQEKIANANSAFSIVSTGSNLIGSVAGGFLYQALGAPALFLFDGLSFLFSGGSMGFVNIPDSKQVKKVSFLQDMKDGFRYMWRFPGMRLVLLAAAMCNFCAYIGITLILPFCNNSPVLGASGYGMIMGSFMGGSMLGFLLFSIVTLKPKSIVPAYLAACLVSNLSFIAGIYQSAVPLMIILVALGGFANALINVLFMAAVQTSTAQEMRGKVMSFMMMTVQGLTPIAMALAGALGEVFPLRAVISSAFAVSMFFSLLIVASRSSREFIVPKSTAPRDEPQAPGACTTEAESEIAEE
ncbi:Transmembrane secretion effector [Caprobacter fermentans]|uniref:MFS transporter n=1 Tax=Caproicibacter fermentans TaxID=2576756 RepID=A0A6N8HYN1_9FIRM|nr:MFS transporter [Caproicibacter fermentans]MVB10926.1 Transmembrane secretion effector [Caproicibacter fermentans]QNK39456.1 MFS transporter [Caproicibacter fermentans]